MRLSLGRAGLPVTGRRVRRVIETVLESERRAAGPRARRSARRLYSLSVTFLSASAMRRLNRTWKGRDYPTDVIAFALPDPDGGLVGDVYICPAVAAAEARSRRIPAREELLRLVVHGLLHVLGYDHPESAARVRSPMWRRQERYLKGLA